ncbi:MAG: LuxR C-terminal-related transcriptional regulator [Rhizobiaceae bacterium]
MTSLALTTAEPIFAPLRTRGDLTGFLTELVEALDADSYLLAALVHDQERAGLRIIASNWLWDAVQLAGQELIASIAQSDACTGPGDRPRPILAGAAPADGPFSGENARLLDVLGHAEICALRLFVGQRRLHLLVSASEPGRIDHAALGWAQMRCSYALSQVPDLLAGVVAENPLSDRERECMSWVAEGKTTDEVALILGVSSNTVNSYIAHVIQKFSARNRAEALATAIRSGIV